MTATAPLRGWRLPVAALGGVLALYYLAALATLLARPPADLLAVLATSRARTAAVTSLATATASTLLSVVFGLPLAVWLARTDSRLRAPVAALVLVPLVLPPVVAGVLLLGLVGPAGLGTLLDGPGLSRSLAGVVLAQTFVASPFFVVTATAAVDGVDGRLEEAARTLGAGPLGVARRVTLPLSAGGLVAGATLTFARAIGEFGATLVVAYSPRTLPTAIWTAFLAEGLTAALALSALLVAAALAALAVLARAGATPWRE
jgi:molybdate/tungstate transport system permease protein